MWTKVVCPTPMCGNRLLAYEPEEGIHAQVKCRNCKHFWEIKAKAHGASIQITPAPEVHQGDNSRAVSIHAN